MVSLHSVQFGPTLLLHEAWFWGPLHTAGVTFVSASPNQYTTHSTTKLRWLPYSRFVIIGTPCSFTELYLRQLRPEFLQKPTLSIMTKALVKLEFGLGSCAGGSKIYIGPRDSIPLCLASNWSLMVASQVASSKGFVALNSAWVM